MTLTEQNLPQFDPQIYEHIALNELVTYSVYFLSQSGKEISAEDIVAACFYLFPKRFSLRGYPQWPDSTVVNKRWIDCRKRGFISGSTASGFSLTPGGLKVAEKVEEILTGHRPSFGRVGQNRVRAELRTRAGRLVKSLEESDAFREYRRNGQRATISEFDFRSMLLCTMESSASTLRSNLEQFRQHAVLYGREDLIDFLEYCEKQFLSLLSDASSGSRQLHGGMLRRKT